MVHNSKKTKHTNSNYKNNIKEHQFPKQTNKQTKRNGRPCFQNAGEGKSYDFSNQGEQLLEIQGDDNIVEQEYDHNLNSYPQSNDQHQVYTCASENLENIDPPEICEPILQQRDDQQQAPFPVVITKKFTKGKSGNEKEKNQGG